MSILSRCAQQPAYCRYTAAEAERQRAEELGATLLYDRTDDDGEPLYVLADPAGHPFCLLVGSGWQPPEIRIWR